MRVIQAETGRSHSMALSSVGEVFAWGYGGSGNLYHGNKKYQLVPKKVEGFGSVTDITAGDAQSLAVVGEEGAVYVWGFNYNGQLGLGDHGVNTSRLVPTVVPGVSGVFAVAAGY